MHSGGWVVDGDVVFASTIRLWTTIVSRPTRKPTRRRKVRIAHQADPFLRASTTRTEPLLRRDGVRSIVLSPSFLHPFLRQAVSSGGPSPVWAITFARRLSSRHL